MFIERRKHKRIGTPILLRFRIKPYKDQETVSSDWDMVAVNDLGAKGVFFNSSKNLEVGTNLDLKIGFSTTTPPIECAGIVTRVKKTPHTSIFGIAAEFTNIDEQEKEIINNTAEDLVK